MWVEKNIIFKGNFTGNDASEKTSVQWPGVVPPFAAFLKVSALGAGTALVMKIQHSPDNGVTWLDLVTFASKNAIGTEMISVAGGFFPTLRVLPTFTGGTTTATVEISLHGGVR